MLKSMFFFRDRELGLRLREVMMCLRLPLTSDSEELRAASLKVVRYLVRGRDGVKAITQVRVTAASYQSSFLDVCCRSTSIT